MFDSTVPENFESWTRFLDVYYEPIRAALRLLPYVGSDRADDVTQSFFLKMHERRFLENRPAIKGRFRDWLYVAARRHAIDEWRKSQRIRERPDAFAMNDPVDLHNPPAEDAAFNVDEFYALSVLHMTVNKVRQHLIDEGKPEHWMIFEELVLAPLFPGRVPKTRAEILAMFPGQEPDYLDNRVTTVKRVFRRILPALLPADPTEHLTPEERLSELLEILNASTKNHLWLAFLVSPIPNSEQSLDSSLELAARSSRHDQAGKAVSPEILVDELRILLAFWLEMPVSNYITAVESVGCVVAELIASARPGLTARRRGAAANLNLKGLIDGTGPSIPPAEMTALLDRVKTFAKRVHRSMSHGRQQKSPDGANRLETSMPPEVAQVVYDLAGALALIRCGTRIIGLSDDRFRKNLAWALDQSWIDGKLRAVFRSALKRLDVKRTS